MSQGLIIQLLVSGIGMGFIFALIAIGLTLIYGVMDVVNFAHGEFLMLAMYASYLAFALWGLDPLVTLPLVGGMMFLFGVGVYYLLVRNVLGGTMHAQIFATFGLMVFLQAAAQFVMGADYFSISGSLLSGVVRVSGRHAAGAAHRGHCRRVAGDRRALLARVSDRPRPLAAGGGAGPPGGAHRRHQRGSHVCAGLGHRRRLRRAWQGRCCPTSTTCFPGSARCSCCWPT